MLHHAFVFIFNAHESKLTPILSLLLYSLQGKLPGAFYRIQDPEAQCFIGRCLETVSKRSSAEELLSDPFLIDDDLRVPLPSSALNTMDKGADRQRHHHLTDVCDRSKPMKPTDMTITGKMNPEDDTIILKVQIADKDGTLLHLSG